MKRFYREVGVGAVAGGYRVLLDARPIRTQGGAPQLVPTPALAEAMAQEWRDQPEKLDPRAFPLRDLADYALDHVAPGRATIIAKLLAFAETDTLCYRADPDEPLFQRQQQVWEPLLTRFEAARKIRLERISGVRHRPQPRAAIAKLHDELAKLDEFTLAALTALAGLAASLSVALEALEPAGDTGADPAALFAAANLEQDWQAEQWGWEHSAQAIRTARGTAFVTATRFARLVRPG